MVSKKKNQVSFNLHYISLTKHRGLLAIFFCVLPWRQNTISSLVVQVFTFQSVAQTPLKMTPFTIQEFPLTNWLPFSPPQILWQSPLSDTNGSLFNNIATYRHKPSLPRQLMARIIRERWDWQEDNGHEFKVTKRLFTMYNWWIKCNPLLEINLLSPNNDQISCYQFGLEIFLQLIPKLHIVATRQAQV